MRFPVPSRRRRRGALYRALLAGRPGQAVIDTSPDIVIVLDSELAVKVLNERARAFAVRAGLFAAIEPGGRSPATSAAWATVLMRAHRGEIVDFAITVDGVSYEVHVHPVPSVRNPKLVVINAHDASAHKAAERARHRLLEAVPDLVAIVKRDGTVTDVKAPHDPAAGLSVDEIDVEVLRARLDQAFHAGVPLSFEYEVLAQAEPRVRAAYICTIGADEAVVLLRDVTEQRRMMSRLLVADRMASLGTLSAGVAHELNNPLAFVITNLDFVEEELRRSVRENAPPPMADLLGAVAESREGLQRMAVIVKDLKTFSRPDEESVTDIDVNRLLDRVLNMAMPEIRHRGTVVKDYGEIDSVHGNEARLGQVFLNQLVNAAQALDAQRIARNVIRLHTGMDRSNVVVEIADNGPGIPLEIRSRVFDPFFTTKPHGVGTGLGLAISLGIVKALGGEIEVHSVLGEGTIFRTILPTAVPSSRATRKSLGKIPVLDRCRILVIDNDPLVLSSMRKMLRDHDVHTANSGEEGGRRLEREDFDLVVCDVMMPGMSGPEFYERVEKRWPGLERRVVLMTGGAVTPEARGFLDAKRTTVLEKPFSRDAVLDCLIRARASVSPLDG